MAKNLPLRERSKRTSQKKYDDYIVYDKSKTKCSDSKFHCIGCEAVFQNQKAFLLHKATCLSLKVDLSKQNSFFGKHFSNQPLRTANIELTSSEENEKVLPPSQPLGMYNHRTEDKSYAAAVSSSNTDTTIQAGDDSECESPKTDTESTVNSISSDADASREIVIENVTAVEELLLTEEVIMANLPTFTSAAEIPNKNYNNIEKVTFTQLIEQIFEDTITWKKNLFLVPSGHSGKEYIKLVTEWLEMFNKDTSFQYLSLKVALHVLPNLLLQKPSASSKAKDHSKALTQRIEIRKINLFWQISMQFTTNNETITNTLHTTTIIQIYTIITTSPFTRQGNPQR